MVYRVYNEILERLLLSIAVFGSLVLGLILLHEGASHTYRYEQDAVVIDLQSLGIGTSEIESRDVGIEDSKTGVKAIKDKQFMTSIEHKRFSQAEQTTQTKQMEQASLVLAETEKAEQRRTVVDTNYKPGDIVNIRCTAYYVSGVTASGEVTDYGMLAGKREWLNRSCNLYRSNPDGSKGELIGTFTFKDTGFGLERLGGIDYPEGTITAGMSIDMWHPTEESCYEYIRQYGDYVYMEFLN